MNNRFNINTNIIIGNGSYRKLGENVKSLGYSKVAIFADEGFAKTKLYEDGLTNLKNNKITNVFCLLCRGSEEPSYDYVNLVADTFRNYDFDLLIGIGGGSCMDVTKAVAAMKTNSGKAEDYKGFDKLNNENIPTLLIPTTAGTGSEATINASFVDNKTRLKLGVNGRFMSANHAILDGEVTVSCPYRAAIGAGADAVVHVLESFVCNNSNSMTRAFACQAMAYLYDSLSSLKSDPGNLTDRLNQLIGAHLAAISLFNSGSGIAGGLSYPLGVHYKVPHGLGGAMFCLDVVEYNIDKGYYEYATLAKSIGYNNPNEKKASLELLLSLKKLFKYLGIPQKLTELGLNSSDRDNLLTECQSLQNAFDQNPVPFTVKNNLECFLNNYF